MGLAQEKEVRLFDTWTDSYDSWFQTPIGGLIKEYETNVLLAMLEPGENELILDVGCGTGIFTSEILARGAMIHGLDLSYPMLEKAQARLHRFGFQGVVGHMHHLPFVDESFDKVYSMTAVEFVSDAALAIRELERVTRKNGRIVMTTLNRLSPWAERRIKKGRAGHSLFKHMTFRSPDDLKQLIPHYSELRTAIHFAKDEKLERAQELEQQGMRREDVTGAFIAISWDKP
ncbi:MAG: class I SAM-dependent methyltransferase [Desulfobulbaceae bacterium]|nr:MAG: class I SAM-dependent methyltransferase [Desulfobulbaceae bacterium]